MQHDRASVSDARQAEQVDQSENRLRQLAREGMRDEIGDLFGLDLEKREDRDLLADMARRFRDRRAFWSDVRSKGFAAGVTTLVAAAVTWLITRYGSKL